MSKKKSKSSADCSEPADFDSLLVEIQRIVEQLENGDLNLSKSLEEYEIAVGKLKSCHALLNAAERKISLLSGFDSNGNPVLQEVESDQDATLAEKQSNRGRRRTSGGGKTKRRKPTAKAAGSDVESADFSDKDEDEGISGVDDADGLF